MLIAAESNWDFIDDRAEYVETKREELHMGLSSQKLDQINIYKLTFTAIFR